MSGEAPDIRFRKVTSEGHCDSVAYQPICRSGEAEILKTFTRQYNTIAQLDHQACHLRPMAHTLPMTGLE